MIDVTDVTQFIIHQAAFEAAHYVLQGPAGEVFPALVSGFTQARERG